MKEFTTNSGARAKVSPAPFQDAIALKNAIMKAVAEAGINIDGLKMENLSLESEIDGNLIDMIVKAVLYVDSSSDVYDILFKCMARCTYNGDRITQDTFESEEARVDYYQLVLEVVKANILPFFKGLVSGLKTNPLFGKMTNNQK